MRGGGFLNHEPAYARRADRIVRKAEVFRSSPGPSRRDIEAAEKELDGEKVGGTPGHEAQHRRQAGLLEDPWSGSGGRMRYMILRFRSLNKDIAPVVLPLV